MTRQFAIVFPRHAAGLIGCGAHKRVRMAGKFAAVSLKNCQGPYILMLRGFSVWFWQLVFRTFAIGEIFNGALFWNRIVAGV